MTQPERAVAAAAAPATAPRRAAALRRSLAAGGWVLVAVVAAGLVAARYRAATSDSTGGSDLSTFLAAARHVADGGSPFDEPAYVYSPWLAIALAPWAHRTAAEVTGPWCALSLVAGLAAVGLVLATVWRRLTAPARPLFALVGVVTLFYGYPAVEALWLGQADFLLFVATAVAVLLATRRRPAWAGALAAVAALVKTWAAPVVLVLVQQPRRTWWRAAAGFVAPLAVSAVVFDAAFGPGTTERWLSRMLTSSDQRLPTYSAWGARDLFSASGVLTHPLVVSPALRWGATAVGLVWAVALAVVALRTGADLALSAWHLVACLVLVLPVSHIAYRIFALPFLWLWLTHGRRLRRPAWAGVLAVMAVAWGVGYRTPAVYGDVTPAWFVAMMAAAYVSLTVSVLAARRLAGPDPGDVERPEPVATA